MSVRLWLACAALLGLTLCGGCGFKDIDKRFFVIATGIDMTGKAETPYRVTLRLAIPYTKAESGEAHTEVETIEGASIAEAIRKLKSHVDKELDFAHCRVILLGKSLAEAGFEDSIEWMSRRRDIQQIAYLGVATPDAHSLLKVKIKSERYPGNAFFLMFGKEGTESSFTVSEYLFDFMRRSAEPGLDPYLPIIGSDGDSYVVDRVALFDKKKLRLILTPEETQLYNIVAFQFNKSGVSMALDGKRLVMFNTMVKVKRSIQTGAQPVVNLRVKLHGIVEESPERIMNGELVAMERRLGENVSEQIEAMLVKIRDAGIDPFGFGLSYMAKIFGRADDWKRWSEAFPSVRYRVKTDVVFTSTGQTR